MKRIAVYTAIFGNRDGYREPPEGDYDCYLFTDVPVQTQHSIVRVMEPVIPGDPVRSARMFKLLPHVFLPDYELTLWLDGDIKLTDPDIAGMEKLYLAEQPMATFKHRYRECAYDEAVECLIRGLDDSIRIGKQISLYRRMGFPRKQGLAETGVQLRRSQDSRVKAFCSAWWEQVFMHSRRDQLSFNFVAWRQEMKYQIFLGRVDTNPHFELDPHDELVAEPQNVILPA